MVISSDAEINYNEISNDQFRDEDNNKKFTFLGWLEPPDQANGRDYISVKTEVDGYKFRSIF